MPHIPTKLPTPLYMPVIDFSSAVFFSFCTDGRTDRQTDRQTNDNKTIHPLQTS